MCPETHLFPVALVTGSRQDGNWILTGFQVVAEASGYLEYSQGRSDQTSIGCFPQESQQEKVTALQGCWRGEVMHVGRKETALGCSDLPGCL